MKLISILAKSKQFCQQEVLQTIN